MDGETRKARTLDALESIALVLERLGVLRVSVLRATVVDEVGNPFVRPNA